jgi:hypothetical protein
VENTSMMDIKINYVKTNYKAPGDVVTADMIKAI